MDAEKYTRRLNVLQSENGGEYLSNTATQFLRSRGIVNRLATPRSPHQNGIVESSTGR